MVIFHKKKKETIFMKKNVIFFLKKTIKERQKIYIIASTLFIYLYILKITKKDKNWSKFE
jgi:hypothetical protein